MDLNRILNSKVLQISFLLHSKPFSINQTSNYLKTHSQTQIVEVTKEQYHLVPLPSELKEKERKNEEDEDEDEEKDPFGIDHLDSLLREFGRTKEAEGKLSRTRNAGVELLEIYKELIKEWKKVEREVRRNDKSRYQMEESFRLLKMKIRKIKKRHQAKKSQRGNRSRDEVRDLAGAFEDKMSFHLKNLLNKVSDLHTNYKNKRSEEKKPLKLKLDNPLSSLYNGMNWKMKMIEEYFRLFRNGMSLQDSIIRETQIDFVKSNMVKRISIDVGGTKADFLQQWEMVSALMPNYSMWVNNIEATDLNGNLLYCNATFSFRITRRYIATLYPHMLSNEEFVNSILGKTIFIAMHMEFLYAQSEKTIIKMEGEAYLVIGWMKLLHNSDLVDKVMYNIDLKHRSDGLIEATEVVNVEDEAEDCDNVYDVY